MPPPPRNTAPSPSVATAENALANLELAKRMVMGTLVDRLMGPKLMKHLIPPTTCWQRLMGEDPTEE